MVLPGEVALLELVTVVFTLRHSAPQQLLPPQSVQAELPLTSVYVPIGHLLHAVSPSKPEYVPGEQVEQGGQPPPLKTVLYSPAAHARPVLPATDRP